MLAPWLSLRLGCSRTGPPGALVFLTCSRNKPTALGASRAVAPPRLEDEKVGESEIVLTLEQHRFAAAEHVIVALGMLTAAFQHPGEIALGQRQQ